MIELDDSLLKYDDPVLVTRTASSSTKGRHLRLSPQQSIDSAPTPPPPRATSTSFQATKQENGFLIIFPPRTWDDGNQRWAQQVSRAPSGKADVQQLVKLLDSKLQQKQAKPTGICPVRRELYSQCFDEVIRQVANNCAARALLLAEVRDELSRITAIYKVQYERGLAFGIRKALQAEDEENDMEQRISELEEEIETLRKQLNEEKAHNDENEQRQADETQVEQQNLSEEIQFLKETHQQYQALLESLMTPK
uniref:Axonemal dynein light intermediate polypeptide 1 n=2 Tax=Nothobranchius korthausae TaxID=1143690 RepID=A0A1A8EKP2_9TELE